LVIGKELNNAFSNNSEKSSVMGDYGGTQNHNYPQNIFPRSISRGQVSDGVISNINFQKNPL